MVIVRREYERFLTWLGEQAATDDTRRMANLVHCHLEELAKLGSGKSSRSKRLVALAQETFVALPTGFPTAREGANMLELPWKRLRRLDVGPFRGFLTAEHFALDRPIVLVYGPNGSGKSSLCEALEHALLGRVAEADARRIESKKYLENAWCREFQPPRLLATAVSGDEVIVEGGGDSFRFCFVEKNRIEDFARLSAKTPMERSRLIATLFGVDSFDDFVRGFNDSLEKQIDLKGPKSAEYAEARQRIKNDEELVAQEAAKRAELTRSGQEIANLFRFGIAFEQMATMLGTRDQPGEVQELERQIERPTPQRIDLTRHEVVSALRHVRGAQARLRELQQRQESRRTEVSFRGLFQAVLDLQSLSPDRCPACDSPLFGPSSAKQNPFEKAKDGLAALAELAILEQQLDGAGQDVADASNRLKACLVKIRSFLDLTPSCAPSAAEVLCNLPKDLRWTWWSVLFDKDRPIWGGIVAACRAIERQDREVAEAQERKTHLRRERDRLRDIHDQVVRHQERQKGLEEALAAAKLRIAHFDQDHKVLSSSLAEEAALVILNVRINAAYDLFLPLLRRYRDDLPGRLVSGLNETAMSFYNRFNCRDPGSDKLVELHLPSGPDDRMEVVFAADPSEKVDALQVLSEGHIRCLGVAILLAKNVQSKSPLLVFDDAVNAIDPDHKEGIRITLFEGHEFAEKQIIVTCHGEDFLKDIENMLGRERRKQDCLSYVLLPHEGDRRIRVDSRPTPRNYLGAAEEKLQRGEVRASTAAGRWAFEQINTAVWKYLEKSNDGTIALNLCGPKAHVEQGKLACSLRKRLKEVQQRSPEPRITELVDGYDFVLDQRNYRLLNIAAHEGEDIEDIDPHQAKDVLDALKRMDACLRST